MLLMPWLGMLKHRLTSGVSQISASRSFRQPAACRKRLAQYRNWGAEPLETRSLLSGIQSGGGGLGGGLGGVGLGTGTQIVSGVPSDLIADTANANSNTLALSADGRYVLFASAATNLLPNQVSLHGFGESDLYLKDTWTDSVTLISHSANSLYTGGNGDSTNGVISADGNTVAYQSTATNLVSGVTDNNNAQDLFVWNRLTNSTTLVTASATVPNSTADNQYLTDPHLSADGTWLAFSSGATNLVPGQVDTPDSRDAFLYNTTTHSLQLISGANQSATTTADSDSTVESVATLSDGSARVLFSSWASNLSSNFTTQFRSNLYIFNSAAGGSLSLLTHASGDPLQSADSNSFDGKLSEDGSVVVFSSRATNLVPGQTSLSSGSSLFNLFIHTFSNNTTALVSHTTASTTQTADGEVLGYDLSGDGRSIVFSTLADAGNMVSGLVDQSPSEDIYLYDVLTGTTQLITFNASTPSHTGSTGVSFPTISDDGSRIAFSIQDPIGSGLFNSLTGTADFGAVVWDRTTNTNRLITHTPGNPTAATSLFFNYLEISSQGDVLYASTYDSVQTLTGKQDHFGQSDGVLYNSTADQWTLVSGRDPNLPSYASNDGSFAAEYVTSDDGRYVAFTSQATNLIGNFVNTHEGSGTDIYLLDRQTGIKQLVSHQSGNTSYSGDNSSYAPSISADGRYVAFFSVATNLTTSVLPSGGIYVWDRETSETTFIGIGSNPIISADGSSIAFSSIDPFLFPELINTNGSDVSDVFVADRVTGAIQLVSHVPGSNVQTANNSSRVQGITGDGRYIVFLSRAQDLITGVDIPSADDVFLFDRQTGNVTWVSQPQTPRLIDDEQHGSISAIIARNAPVVIFASGANDLLNGQSSSANSGIQLYRFDGSTNTLRLVTQAGNNPLQSSDGHVVLAGDQFLTPYSVSADGRYVAFQTTATDLGTDVNQSVNDTNGDYDIYRFDAEMPAEYIPHRLVSDSHAVDHETGSAASTHPRISLDGNVVVFQTATPATSFISSTVDSNDTTDLFSWKGITGTIQLLTQSSSFSLQSANLASSHPVLSGDGTSVIFRSLASNLIEGDLNNAYDIYVTPITNLAPILGGWGGTPVKPSDPANIEFGPITAIDAEDDLLTYEIIPGSGGEAYVHFQAGTNRILWNGPTYNPPRFINLQVRITDSHGAYSDSYVQYELDLPVQEIEPGSITVDEGITGQIAVLSVIDPNGTQERTYSLVPGAGEDDNALFSIIDNKLNIVTPLNYEDRSVYSIRVRVTTNGSQAGPDIFEQRILIHVNNVAETGPALVTTSPSTVTANQLVKGDLNFPSASGNEAISSNGRWMLFWTAAHNVVPGQSMNLGTTQLYLQDNWTRDIYLVTGRFGSATLGSDNSGPIEWASVSDDGRYVAFLSAATNLVNDYQLDDQGYHPANLYLFDRLAGSTTLISHQAGNASTSAAAGLLGLGTTAMHLSRNGRTLVFESSQTDLSVNQPPDAGFPDVFSYDIPTGQLSYLTSGQKRLGPVSADGNFVLYTTPRIGSPGEFDLFRFNLRTQTAVPLVHSGGTPSDHGVATDADGRAISLAISEDGLRVSYLSAATDLVPGQLDTYDSLHPENSYDLFVYDEQSGLPQTILISRQAGTTNVASNGIQPSTLMDRSGRYVAFSTGVDANFFNATFSDDGAGRIDSFLYDILTDTYSIITHSSTAGETAVGAEVADQTIQLVGISDYRQTSVPLVLYSLTNANYVTDLVEGAQAPPPEASRPLLMYTMNEPSAKLITHTVGNVATLSTGWRGNAIFSDVNWHVYYEIRDLPVQSDPNPALGGLTTTRYIASDILSDGIGGNGYRQIADWSYVTNTTQQLVFGQISSSASNYGTTSTTLTGGTDLPYYSVSDDGRYIAYASQADSLVDGFIDANDRFYDVYLRDTLGGTTSLVSHAADTPLRGGNHNSLHPVLSADGHYLVYLSAATDLIDGQIDPNGTQYDVFVYDILTGTTRLVSHDAEDASKTAAIGIDIPEYVAISPQLYDQYGLMYQFAPAISVNGDTILFVSPTAAGNLVSGANGSGTNNIYRWSRSTGEVTLVTHAAGNPLQSADDLSYGISLSDDGMRAVFLSQAQDLIADQPLAGGTHAFIVDFTTGTTRLIDYTGQPVNEAGYAQPGAGNVHQIVISGDGSHVAFVGDGNGVGTTIDNNNGRDVFVYDVATRELTLISHSISSPITTGNSESYDVSISDDGQHVVFHSHALDLKAGVTGTLNGVNVYYYTVADASLILVDHVASDINLGSDQGAEHAVISGDGRRVAYHSWSYDLVSGVSPNGYQQVYLWDSVSNQSTLLSRMADNILGPAAGDSSSVPVMNQTGEVIVFRSASSRLAPGDYNGPSPIISGWDLFVANEPRVNHAPIAISPNAVFVQENLPAGSLVASLTLYDPDPGDTLSVELTSGLGDTDNGQFYITHSVDGWELYATNSFDYETQSSYSVRLRVTDAGGLNYEQILEIFVINVAEPLLVQIIRQDVLANVALNGSGQLVVSGIANAVTADPAMVTGLELEGSVSPSTPIVIDLNTYGPLGMPVSVSGSSDVTLKLPDAVGSGDYYVSMYNGEVHVSGSIDDGTLVEYLRIANPAQTDTIQLHLVGGNFSNLIVDTNFYNNGLLHWDLTVSGFDQVKVKAPLSGLSTLEFQPTDAVVRDSNDTAILTILNVDQLPTLVYEGVGSIYERLIIKVDATSALPSILNVLEFAANSEVEVQPLSSTVSSEVHVFSSETASGTTIVVQDDADSTLLTIAGSGQRFVQYGGHVEVVNEATATVTATAWDATKNHLTYTINGTATLGDLLVSQDSLTLTAATDASGSQFVFDSNVQLNNLTLSPGIGQSQITVHSGAVTITNAFNLQNIVIDGGTLTLNANVAVGNAFLQSGGEVNGSGYLTLQNYMELSGGTQSGAGTTDYTGTQVAQLTNFALRGNRLLHVRGIPQLGRDNVLVNTITIADSAQLWTSGQTHVWGGTTIHFDPGQSGGGGLGGPVIVSNPPLTPWVDNSGQLTFEYHPIYLSSAPNIVVEVPLIRERDETTINDINLDLQQGLATHSEGTSSVTGTGTLLISGGSLQIGIGLDLGLNTTVLVPVLDDGTLTVSGTAYFHGNVLNTVGITVTGTAQFTALVAPAVSIQNGGYVYGSGSFLSPVTVSAGGIFEPTAPAIGNNPTEVAELILQTNSQITIRPDGLKLIVHNGLQIGSGTADLVLSHWDWNPGLPPVVFIQSDAPGPIGYFRNLPEGALISGPNGQYARISYLAGDGNDISLTWIAPTIGDYYVIPAAANMAVGTDPDGAGPAIAVGFDTFATVQAAIDAMTTNGVFATIYITPGSYPEDLVLSFEASLRPLGTGRVSLGSLISTESLSLKNIDFTAADGVAPLQITNNWYVILEGVRTFGTVNNQIATEQFTYTQLEGHESTPIQAKSGLLIAGGNQPFELTLPGLAPSYTVLTSENSQSPQLVTVTPGDYQINVYGQGSYGPAVTIDNSNATGTSIFDSGNWKLIQFTDRSAILVQDEDSLAFTSNVAPVIGGISENANYTITANQTGLTLGFTVTDDILSSDALWISATSSNQALIADADIEILAQAAPYTNSPFGSPYLWIHNTTGQQGSTIITLTVDDGMGGVTVRHFTVTIGAAAAPTTVYVDPDVGSVPSGTYPFSSNLGYQHAVGYDVFATIQQAIDAVGNDGTVYIASRSYVENLTISNKSVNIIGQGTVAIDASHGIGLSATGPGAIGPVSELNISGLIIYNASSALQISNYESVDLNGIRTGGTGASTISLVGQGRLLYEQVDGYEFETIQVSQSNLIAGGNTQFDLTGAKQIVVFDALNDTGPESILFTPGAPGSRFELQNRGSYAASVTINASAATTPQIFGDYTYFYNNALRFGFGNKGSVVIPDFVAFTLQTSIVNTAPQIIGLAASTTTPWTISAQLPFTVADDITDGSAMQYTITSSNPSVLGNFDAYVTGTGNQRTLVINPISGHTGVATLTVTALDRMGLSTSWDVTVTVIEPPRLSSGTGDGAATVEFANAMGEFAYGLYDPVGPIAAADTTFQSGIVFRATDGSGSTPSLLSAIATGGQFTNGAGTSVFYVGSLRFDLVQTIQPLLDGQGNRTGSQLIQTYTITNTGNTNSTFELYRYFDGDLSFDGTILDGGGRLIRADGTILFETDAGGSGQDSSTFVGIQTSGGTVPGTNWYEVSGYSTLYGKLVSSTPLSDTVVGDMNGDGFVDAGHEYDLALALRNIFQITAGGSTQYTTKTYFGGGAPSTSVNVPPTILPIVNQTLLEDSPPFIVPVVVQDSDSPLQSLTIVASTDNTQLFPNGVTVVNQSGSIQLRLTPGPNQFGTAQVTVTVTDPAGNSAARTFMVTVLPVNDLPFIQGTGERTAIVGQAIPPMSLTVGDVETAAGALVISAQSSNSLLINSSGLVITGSGANRTLTMTPIAGATGTTTITLTIQDADGGISTATFPLTISPVFTPPVNLAPIVIVQPSFSMLEDTHNTIIGVQLSDDSTPVDQLAVTVTSSNTTLFPQSNLLISLAGSNRSLRVTPAPNQFGIGTISITATDSQGLSSTSMITIMVLAVNDLPTVSVSSPTVTIQQGTTISPITVFVSDVETPSREILLSATSSNTQLIDAAGLVFAGTHDVHLLQMTPIAGATGTATITVRALDAEGGLAETTIVLTVNPVVVPPPTVPGSIRGQLFQDLDGSGARNGSEPALAGYEFYVDLNSNGRLDATEPRTSTDSQGAFQLSIAPGTYLVRQNLSANWRQTSPAGGNGLFVTVVEAQASEVLTFADQDDHGDVSTTATVLTLPGTNALTRSGLIQSATDTDLFRTTLNTTGSLSISLTPAGSLDATLRIYRIGTDGDRTLVGEDALGGLGRVRTIEIRGTADTQFEIQVTGFNGSQGSYSLRAQSTAAVADDFGNTRESAEPLTLGPSGFVQAGRIEAGGDLDLFRITPSAAGLLTVSIRTTDSGRAPAIFLSNSSGRLLIVGDASTQSYTWNVDANQTYYIIAGGVDSTIASYELRGSLLSDDAGNTVLSATPLAMNGAGASAFAGSIENPGDWDIFQVTATVTGNLVITLNIVDGVLDPQLAVFSSTLVDSSGEPKRLAFNDNQSATNVNSRVVIPVVAGQTYYIRANGFGTTTGNYLLQMSTQVPDDFPDSLVDATAISVPAGAAVPIGMTLTSGDNDFVKFQATVTGVATVNTSRTGFLFSTIAVRSYSADGIRNGSANLDVSEAGDSLSFQVTAGNWYYLRLGREVDGLPADGMTVTLQVVETALKEQPAKIVEGRQDEAVQKLLDENVQSAVRQTTQSVIEQINTSFIDDLVEYLGGLSQFTEPVLVIWFDPVDFVLTDPSNRQVGFTQSEGQVNEVGSKVSYSGNGATQWLVVPQAQAAQYNLQLVGVGAAYRVGANLITSTGVQSITLQDSFLKGDAQFVLDFGGKTPTATTKEQVVVSTARGSLGNFSTSGASDASSSTSLSGRTVFATSTSFGSPVGPGGGVSSISLGQGGAISGGQTPTQGVGGSAFTVRSGGLFRVVLDAISLPFSLNDLNQPAEKLTDGQRQQRAVIDKFWTSVGRRMLGMPTLGINRLTGELSTLEQLFEQLETNPGEKPGQANETPRNDGNPPADKNASTEKTSAAAQPAPAKAPVSGNTPATGNARGPVPGPAVQKPASRASSRARQAADRIKAAVTSARQARQEWNRLAEAWKSGTSRWASLWNDPSGLHAAIFGSTADDTAERDRALRAELERSETVWAAAVRAELSHLQRSAETTMSSTELAQEGPY